MSELNDIGLFLNIVSAALIWKFGLPEQVAFRGKVYLIPEELNARERRQLQCYKALSNSGMAFLILGFVFQLVSAYTY
jgi:hypothetical protein